MSRKPRRGENERVGREAFGFDELRPGQAEAIEAVLDGRDVKLVAERELLVAR